jgi:hypothetical protein
MSFALYYVGRLAEAEALLPDLEATSTRAGHQGAVWAHERLLHGMEFTRSGDIRRFLAHTERSFGAFSAVNFLLEQQVAACHTHLGDLERAIESLARVNEPEEQAHRGTIEACAFAIAALRGDVGEARARLADATPWLPTVGRVNIAGAWHVLETVVPALMLIDARDRCAELYPAALELVATGMVCNNLSLGPTNSLLAAGLSAWAGGHVDAARAHFEMAERLSREIPFRFLQPAVAYWHGRMLREIGDPKDQPRGRAMLESAAADFGVLGMPVHAALAARTL